jgi:hypothetical protein
MASATRNDWHREPLVGDVETPAGQPDAERYLVEHRSGALSGITFGGSGPTEH